MQRAERGDLCAKLYSQKNWHEGKVSGGGCDVHRATSFTFAVPKGGEVAARLPCPEGSSKGQSERHPQPSTSDFWKRLKLSSCEQLH